MSHHYGEDSSSYRIGPKNCILRFNNKVTGKTIKLVIPIEKSGLSAKPELRDNQVNQIIFQLAGALREVLE